MITHDTEPQLAPMLEDSRAKIDAADWQTLRLWWDTYPIGHPLFMGETGQHFYRAMRTKAHQQCEVAHA